MGNSEEIQLAIARFWYSMSSNLRIHEIERVVLSIIHLVIVSRKTICSAFVVARVEVFIVELALGW
jgi:hypothetical protein